MAHRSKGFTHGEAPPTAPYLIVQLKEGWWADMEANAFVKGRRRLKLDELLDEKVSLQPHIAALTGKPTRALSAAERGLATFVQVRTASMQMDRVAQRLASFDAVEQVVVSPQVSLPSS